MTNSKVAAMPLWILFGVPAASIAAITCAIAFSSHPVVVDAALLISFCSGFAACVVLPVAIYALSANPALRTVPQGIGIVFCSLPILGMIASMLFGGI